MAGTPTEPVAHLLPSEPSSPHPPQMDSWDRRWFQAIMGLTLILRMGYFTGHVKVVYFSQPVLTAQRFYEAARYLAEDGESRVTTAFDPPLWSWLFSPIYQLVSEPARLPITYLVQHFMGLATVMLVFATAFRIAGRWPAVLASILTATYGPLAAYSNMTLPVALTALLLMLLVYFLIRSATEYGVEYLMVAGIVFALCALVYPGIYVFLPVALIRLITLPPPVRSKGPPFRTPTEDLIARLGAWANPIAFLIPIGLGIAFFGIVTSAQVGHFAPFPYRGGVYAWLGNGPTADGIHIEPPETFSSAEPASPASVETYAYQVMLEEQPGTNPAPMEIWSYWMRRAGEAIASDWERSLSLLAKKAWLLLSHTEGSNQVSYTFLRQINPFARWWPSTYGLIAFFAILGFWTAAHVPWTWPRHWLWMLLLCLWAVTVFYYVDGESRAQTVPLLSVVSAIGMQRAFRYVTGRPARRRYSRRFGLPIAGLAGFFIFVDWFAVGQSQPARDWWRYALAAHGAQEWEAAARACDMAMERGVRDTWVYVYRGDLYRDRQRDEDALNMYERALLLDPNHPEPYFKTALVMRDRQDYALAVALLRAARLRAPTPMPVPYRSEYGMLALRAGDLQTAFDELNLAMAYQPRNVAALLGLAEISRRRGDMNRYAILLARAASLDRAQVAVELDRIKRPIPPEAMEAEPYQANRKLIDQLRDNGESEQ